MLQLLQEQLAARDDVLVVYVSPWEYDRNTDRKASLIGAVSAGLREKSAGMNPHSSRSAAVSVSCVSASISRRAVRLAATSALTMTLPSVKDLVAGFAERNRKEQVLARATATAASAAAWPI